MLLSSALFNESVVVSNVQQTNTARPAHAGGFVRAPRNSVDLHSRGAASAEVVVTHTQRAAPQAVLGGAGCAVSQAHIRTTWLLYPVSPVEGLAQGHLCCTACIAVTCSWTCDAYRAHCHGATTCMAGSSAVRSRHVAVGVAHESPSLQRYARCVCLSKALF